MVTTKPFPLIFVHPLQINMPIFFYLIVSPIHGDFHLLHAADHQHRSKLRGYNKQAGYLFGFELLTKMYPAPFLLEDRLKGVE